MFCSIMKYFPLRHLDARCLAREVVRVCTPFFLVVYIHARATRFPGGGGGDVRVGIKYLAPP